jgi:leader peptidase (prepilin peptidase) / N-methyltransferase
VTELALALAYALLGLLVAPFLNVVIDRVPDKLRLRGTVEGELVAPAVVAGIPLQPWLARRGTAPGGGRLPARWLRVEVLTAVTFGALGVRYGDQLGVVALLVLTAALLTVSVIDLQVLRIPDRVTFPVLGASAILIPAISLIDGYGGAITGALVGMVAYFLALVLPHLVYPVGMGFGDVKLALLMGLHLGWIGWSESGPVVGPIRVVLYALIAGCVIGAVFGIAVALARGKRGAFPFGPALAAACYLMLFVAPDLRL